MAQANANGDSGEFSSRQWKLVTEVLNKRGFSDAKVTVNAVGEAGDNYVANVKRVVAEKNGETFKIVAKVAPTIDNIRIAMNARLLFLNEHIMYTEVLPKFTELEKAAGIPDDERLKYAECYGTITEEKDEFILLEDLKDSDFTMLDRFKSLTDSDIKLVLKSFAKLHTLSYILKHQEPETYANFKNKLLKPTELFDANIEQTKAFFEVVELTTSTMFQDQNYKNCVKGTITKFLDINKRLSDWDFNSRYSVIQQGDSWTNNILFKLEDGKTVSCCMIDYQISKINSPVSDLMYLIFNCTDADIRTKYYYDWIDYYHSELAKYLYEFGLKVDYVYPRDQLDADLKRHGKLTLATSIMLTFVLCRDSAEAGAFKDQILNTDMNDTENMDAMIEMMNVTSMSEKTQIFFKTKVEGVIKSCLEFGLITL